VPHLHGPPQSNVQYEIDEWANVLEFEEESPVGTVVGHFEAVDLDHHGIGWKGYELIDHGSNISWSDAKAAADAADAAEKAAIEAYMKDNEKGDVTRTRNVEEESRRLREELEQLKAERSALQDALKKASGKDKKSEIWNLAGLYAEMGNTALVESLEKRNISAAGSILLALWQEANGQYAEAKKHRSRVLDSASKGDLEVMARSVAFDSLRENVLPRKQTVGGQ